jgi:hypothetical protein
VTARQAATADVGRPPFPDVERVQVDGDGRRLPIAPPQRHGIYARYSIPAVPTMLVTEAYPPVRQPYRSSQSVALPSSGGLDPT